MTGTITSEVDGSIHTIKNPGNPFASAGPDQTVNDNQVTLDGSESSDSDGTIESWDWQLNYKLINIPSFNRTATGENPTVDNLMKGIYDVTWP